MTRSCARTCFIALATAFFVTVSTPLAPSPAVRPAEGVSPDPETVALMEELVVWLSGHRTDGGRFRVLDHDSLLAAIRARPRSFELFRRFNGTEANRRLLDGVPYGQSIYRAARRHRLDSLLLAAVVEAESNFDPRAVSPAGAVGLAQVMPGNNPALSVPDLQDPEKNLDAGARYLRGLLDHYGGDLELALAAYNAGPGNVARYDGVPPFPETRHYIRKVLGIYVALHRDVWQATGAGDELLHLSPRAGARPSGAAAEVRVG